MTEDEAKTKWCPFARPALVYRKGGEYTLVKPQGRDHTEDADGHLADVAQNCIGSACMAWRPVYTQRNAENRHLHEDAPAGSGFCGLSGAQQ